MTSYSFTKEEQTKTSYNRKIVVNNGHIVTDSAVSASEHTNTTDGLTGGIPTSIFPDANISGMNLPAGSIPRFSLPDESFVNANISAVNSSEESIQEITSKHSDPFSALPTENQQVKIPDTSRPSQTIEPGFSRQSYITEQPTAPGFSRQSQITEQPPEHGFSQQSQTEERHLDKREHDTGSPSICRKLIGTPDLPEMTSTRAKLMAAMPHGSYETPHAKISIVGCGQVGMAGAFAIMLQGIAAEIVLVDVNTEKLLGEKMDMQHGQAFLRAVKIKSDCDYAVTNKSKICVVTAGVRQHEGENRRDLVQRNLEIFKNIIPQLVRHSPDTILIIVSNPVDILSYVAWKLSGLPKERVIGSGTVLDSSRFRFLLSERLGIAPSNCHGYIIGEHGDSSVAVWSGVNIAGINLRTLNPLVGKAEDPEKWADLHQKVINSAYEIIRLKGYTSWAIGLVISRLCECILKNQNIVYSVSTYATGFHNLTDDLYLSLPSVIGEGGISHVIKLTLDETEQSQLEKCAGDISKILKTLQY